MSGKPNSVEVGALVINIERMNVLSESLARRRSIIEREQSAAKAEQDEYSMLASKSKELIEGMDVRSEGNYGFAGRYHWFLLELVEQAQSSARSKP